MSKNTKWMDCGTTNLANVTYDSHPDMRTGCRLGISGWPGCQPLSTTAPPTSRTDKSCWEWSFILASFILTPPLCPPQCWHNDLPKTQAGATHLYNAIQQPSQTLEKNWSPFVLNLAPAYLSSCFLLHSPGLLTSSILTINHTYQFPKFTIFSCTSISLCKSLC